VERSLRKLRFKLDPSAMVIADDCDGPTWRHELTAAYKATRPEPPDGFHEAVCRVRLGLAAAGCPILSAATFEADDVIRSVVSDAKAAILPCVIVTSDKDLMQLVDNTNCITVWDPARDQLFDEAAVKERLGVPPKQVRDLLALMGDSSDNITGVPGIGPKTAIKLLEEHRSFGGVMAASAKGLIEGRAGKLIAEGEAAAMLAWKLVELRHAPVSVPRKALR